MKVIVIGRLVVNYSVRHFLVGSQTVAIKQ